MPPLPLKLSYGSIGNAIETPENTWSEVHDASAKDARSGELRVAVIAREAVPGWVTSNESQIFVEGINDGRVIVIFVAPNAGCGHARAIIINFGAYGMSASCEPDGPGLSQQKTWISDNLSPTQSNYFRGFPTRREIVADVRHMRSLVSYARSVFWTVGLVDVLLGVYLAIRSFGTHSPKARPHAAEFMLAIGLATVALGVLSCFAAMAFRHRNRFSKPLIAMNSLVTLLLFPFGTVAGGVGLYWCFSPKMREAEPLVEDFEHQPRPGDGTHRWTQKAAPVLGIVIWLGSFAGAAWWGRAHGLPTRAAINGLPLLFLCEWIAVFLHELGHAVAGWASDMQLASFLVGPFLAQKRAGRWKFEFRLAGLLNTGGAVATVPLHLKRLRGRMAFEVAGGPIASLVTAAVAFLVLLMMPGSAYAAWWKVPAVVGAISAGATVLNLIPFRFAAGVSDGALLVQLFRGGQFADLRAAMKMVGSTTVTSTRPRDLNSQALADGLRAGAGTPEEGTLQIIQLICALDRGELVQARKHLEASLERIPAPEKAPNVGCAAELAFYMAYLDGDAGRAGEWLRGAEELAAARKLTLAKDSDYWRALTAVREAEGQRGQAEAAYQQANQLLGKKPTTGLYQFERELLETVHKGGWLRRQEGALSEAPI